MNVKRTYALVLGGVFLLIFIIACIPDMVTWPAITPHSTSVGAVMWKGRTMEVIFQGFIILAGVVSILLLLGTDKSRRMQP
jgi:ABC-type Fe3+ transport system permease subunit